MGVHVEFGAARFVAPDTVEVDIMGGENRQPDYVAKNPSGELPALELDDGSILAETVAICRYFEGVEPEPPLLGVDVGWGLEHGDYEIFLAVGLTDT